MTGHFRLLLGITCMLLHIQIYAQNLVDNGDFEKDYDHWSRLTGNNGSMTFYSLDLSTVHNGAQSMRVSTKAIGQKPWDNQLIHKGFYPTKGDEYTLSFFAKSREGAVEMKAVMQNTTYSEQTYTIGTEWTKYTWEFKAAEEFLQLKFFFTALGTIFLDDITIIGKNYVPIVIRPTDTTRISIAVKHQTIEGFGSALAFYEGWVTDHPAKEEMYRLAFQDLGLDWLRIRNDYKYQPDFEKAAKEFVTKAKQWRGDSIRVLMCGWTPPAELKSNNNANNGTLKKTEQGFVYDAYAKYWRDALLAYHAKGIYPDWLSIQNEPDWLTDQWETCKFEPTESAQYPGYDKAFAAVMKQFADIDKKPLMLGSEMLGIGNNQFYSYNTPIKNNSDLYAYAYHLYNGGDPDFPDSYNAALQNIKKDFGNKPNVMTEYEHRKGELYKTAWLMNNVLTQANATAYFYWDLIWPNAGLIDIDNPYDKAGWRNSKGYQLTPHYYAYKHFTRFIHAGYTRVDHTCSNPFVRASAYISPDGKQLTVVMINPTEQAITSSVDIGGGTAKKITVYQSITNDYFKQLPTAASIQLPAKSVTTIVYSF